MGEPRPPGYRPFPPFADWAVDGESLSDVDAATTRFAQFRRRVPTDALDRALEAARRTAAVDTNAIEGVFTTDRGFTRTVAAKAGAWEQAMDVKGPHVRPAFEDTLAGFEMVLDRTTGARPVTEAFLRELHSVMLASQATHTVFVPVDGRLVAQRHELPKGVYKTSANSPTRPDGHVHPYAPVDLTAPEMARLVAELRSEPFLQAHPVVQAAYAHHAFVCVHPFADGNGRVARALASVYLYRSPGVPLVVYNDQRSRYLDALEAADRGAPAALVRFFAEQVTDTVNLVEAEVSAAAAGTAEEALAARLERRSTPESTRAAATRLVGVVRTELTAQSSAAADRLGLPIQVLTNAVGDILPDDYALVSDETGMSVVVFRTAPTRISVTVPLAVGRRTTPEVDFDLLVASGTDRHLGVYLRELDPAITENLRRRVELFVSGVLDDVLREVSVHLG